MTNVLIVSLRAEQEGEEIGIANNENFLYCAASAARSPRYTSTISGADTDLQLYCHIASTGCYYFCVVVTMSAC